MTEVERAARVLMAFIVSPIFLCMGLVFSVTDAWHTGLALCIAAVWARMAHPGS